MKLSKEEYNLLIKRNPRLAPDDHTSYQGQANPLIQKPKENGKEKVIFRPKNPEKGGRDNPRFKITATFFMSDNRVRDLDGMLATILDSICTARRSLADNP